MAGGQNILKNGLAILGIIVLLLMLALIYINARYYLDFDFVSNSGIVFNASEIVLIFIGALITPIILIYIDKQRKSIRENK